MSLFQAELRQQLDEWAGQSLLRTLRPVSVPGCRVQLDGRELVNLSGNDYLGLSGHPRLKRAAVDAIGKYGVGSGASRLVCGHLQLHDHVERRFALFKKAQAALLLPSGYMANLAVLSALPRRGDLILIDKRSHASLIDAARASAASIRTFPHLDYARLARLLSRFHAPARRGGNGKNFTSAAATHTPRCYIVTDSVFSMDGDVADLSQLCELARRYGAVTVIDEAHGTGLLGQTGSGLCEAQGVCGQVDIVISTASKALGGLGGVVTGSQLVIDTLINRARPFVYTTAVAPSQAAVISAALDVVEQEPWRRHRVATLAARIWLELGRFSENESVHRASARAERASARATKSPQRGCEIEVSAANRDRFPIIPLITGTAASALGLAEHLAEAGFLAVAIRPPTVPPGTSRVRLSLRADLTDADMDRLLEVLTGVEDSWQLGCAGNLVAPLDPAGQSVQSPISQENR